MRKMDKRSFIKHALAGMAVASVPGLSLAEFRIKVPAAGVKPEKESEPVGLPMATISIPHTDWGTKAFPDPESSGNYFSLDGLALDQPIYHMSSGSGTAAAYIEFPEPVQITQMRFAHRMSNSYGYHKGCRIIADDGTGDWANLPSAMISVDVCKSENVIKPVSGLPFASRYRIDGAPFGTCWSGQVFGLQLEGVRSS